MPKLITTRTRIADLGKPRIVVIGGGFGGLEVIKKLSGFKAQTVLFDKTNHHCFQPLLYQVATSGLETSSIVMPFRRRFNGQKDFYFRLGEVTDIKAEANYIETSIGGVRYDYLVIANGASTNYYGMEDVRQYARPLKTIVDAIKLRNIIIRNCEQALLTDDSEVMNSLMDYVIVGGGPTGVELAGALAELKLHVFPKDYRELELSHMDIHLVEANSKLLGGMSAAASERAIDYLQRMGVKVHLNCIVKSYDGYSVMFNTGERLISRTMIWAAGVSGKPIPGLRDEVLGRSGRIKVDEFNRVLGYDNIFAIGDAAVMENVDADYSQGHPMTAPPAIQQGRHVAGNIRRLINKKPMKPFRYTDKGTMATIGRNKAVADIGKLRAHGFIAWLIWMLVHLIYLIGFRNKFLVMLSWFWSYFSYDKSNRLIIARPREGV